MDKRKIDRRTDKQIYKIEDRHLDQRKIDRWTKRQMDKR